MVEAISYQCRQGQAVEEGNGSPGGLCLGCAGLKRVTENSMDSMNKGKKNLSTLYPHSSPKYQIKIEAFVGPGWAHTVQSALVRCPTPVCNQMGVIQRGQAWTISVCTPQVHWLLCVTHAHTTSCSITLSSLWERRIYRSLTACCMQISIFIRLP